MNTLAAKSSLWSVALLGGSCFHYPLGLCR